MTTAWMWRVMVRCSDRSLAFLAILNQLVVVALGTHVAGTVGGADYGVAKEVNLISVKVLDGVGNGHSGHMIIGLQKVRENVAATGRPSVVQMSLSFGSIVSSVEQEIDRVIADGIVIVVSAGNKNTDSCTFTPSHSNAIVVAASTSEDQRAAFSNWGADCTDIFVSSSDGSILDHS